MQAPCLECTLFPKDTRTSVCVHEVWVTHFYCRYRANVACKKLLFIRSRETPRRLKSARFPLGLHIVLGQEGLKEFSWLQVTASDASAGLRGSVGRWISRSPCCTRPGRGPRAHLLSLTPLDVLCQRAVPLHSWGRTCPRHVPSIHVLGLSHEEGESFLTPHNP